MADFYSRRGPCIMMAPVFKDAAKELPDVKFIKVDVQRSYVGVQIRADAAFHFYLQGKLENQFSGARSSSSRCSRSRWKKAEDAIEVSLGAIQTHNNGRRLDKARRPPARPLLHPPASPPAISSPPAFHLPGGRDLREVPGVQARADPQEEVRQGARVYEEEEAEARRRRRRPPRRGSKGVDFRKMDIEDLKAEVYRRESAQEKKADGEEEPTAARQGLRRQARGGRGAHRRPRAAGRRRKIAIIGGGPAGVTAAICAARAGLKPVLIAPAMGDKLMSKGVNVENYPGLTELSGGDIIKLVKRQAMRFAATPLGGACSRST